MHINNASSDLKKAFKELYYWQCGNEGDRAPTNFSSQLYELIGKADMENKFRIAKGFPEYVKAYELWQNSFIDLEEMKSFL